MQVNNWIINALSSYWKDYCSLCGGTATSSKLLCANCLNDILTDRSVCRRCALPLETEVSPDCGACQASPPPYRSVFAFASYRAPLDRLILQFKFQQKVSVGHNLGLLMAREITQQQLSMPDVLVPVPLHASRLRQRGYNQALELARPIARKLKLSLDINSCVRQKATTEQTGLSAKKRASNLKGAFAVNGSFKDKKVAIIDDVMTTGSTVHELSQQLINAGARQVDVWVCARAEL